MPMTNYGLSKLVEELGECAQVAGKMLQYPELMKDRERSHPDGKGPLPQRLQEEIADVMAAAEFCMSRLQLDWGVIGRRKRDKNDLFWTWHGGHDNAPLPPSESGGST